MDVSHARRVTIDADPRAFPSKQAFIDNNRNMWWDLHFLHLSFCWAGLRSCKKDWLRWCKDVLQKPTIPLGALLRCRTSSSAQDPVANVCSTSGMCTLLWVLADVSRRGTTAHMCADSLKHASRRACEVTVCDVTLDGLESLRVTPHGRLHGLREFLSKSQHGLHSQQVEVLKGFWQALHTEGTVGDIWEQDSHTIVDILHFALFFSRTRRSLSQTPLPRVVRFLKMLRNALILWLAPGMEKYVLDVYSLYHDVTKPAPTHSSHRPIPVASRDGEDIGCKRKYVQVNPEVAWDMIEQARNTGTTVSQVIKVRRTDDHVGCAASNADTWVRKHHCMYQTRRGFCFGPGVNHINAIADPATHSKKETMVVVFWSWENQVGAYGDTQRLSQSKTVLPTEQEMPQHIADLQAMHRLERVKSFKQLQAFGNTLYHLTEGRKTCISSFCLPASVYAQPVQENEVRVVQANPHPAASRVLIVNTQTGTTTQALPDDIEDVSLLVLGLDQGSIGTSGAAYMDHVGSMVHCKFDKFHRIIRDVKLALEHACEGIFLKAQVFSTYIWSVNAKPFGTGAFGTQKKWLLDTFLAMHDCDSDVFKKYACKIAEDFGMPSPAASREDLEAVWIRVGTLRSFNQHADIVKLGRWFSWNAAAHSQMCEFHASKMLMEAFVNSTDPDLDAVAFDDLEARRSAKSVAADLSKLRRASGGLPLAYRLMSSQLLECVRVMYVVTRGCWTWYADEVKKVKSPHQGLQCTLAASQGRWASSQHLQQTIHDSLYNRDDLKFMGIDISAPSSGQTRKHAHWALMLMLHVLRNRVWSLAARHHIPPEVYVGVLSPSPHRRAETMEAMERHWRKLTQLEQGRFASATAKQLWEDITFAGNLPVRMMYMFFERSDFPRNGHCSAGIKLLRGMLEVLPDNKVVEDIHNSIRRGAKATPYFTCLWLVVRQGVSGGGTATCAQCGWWSRPSCITGLGSSSYSVQMLVQ